MKRPLACLMALTLLGACSGIKPYPDRSAKNVRIHTATDSSFFSKVRTAVDIYRIEGACETAYEGTVQLRESTATIGLPVDRPVYLVFVFAGSSFLGNSQSSTTYETVFHPSPGGQYEFEVSYADRIYGVRMRENRSGGDAWTQIESQPLKGC